MRSSMIELFAWAMLPNGPGVQQHRLALERLHEVRLDRVLHDDGHGAGDLEVLGGDGLAVARLGDDDPAEPVAEVPQVVREGEDRHDLRGRGDHEASSRAGRRGPAAEADDRVAELAVVHVERPRPRDRRRVDVERVAVMEGRVEGRREQVVRGGHRVEVAVEVEVDLLHRDDLRVAAAGAAALDPEHGTHRRARAGRA